MARAKGSFSGTLLVGALVLYALAQAFIYILVAAGAVLVGWLAWKVFRAVREKQARPTLTRVDPLLDGGAPIFLKEAYHTVLPVDPGVFDDTTTAEVAALEVFSAWVRELPMAPQNPTELVHGLTLRTRYIGRLTTRCHGKRIIWQSSPYGGRQPVGAPDLLEQSIDAWSADPVETAARSRHVASCDTCQGQGKVFCPECAGAGRVRCDECGGGGKVDGVTAAGHRRLLNCRSCRGRGDVKCFECAEGRVECPTCHGSKKLERWMEIQESFRFDIQYEPDGDVARAFSWGTDGQFSKEAELTADAKILSRIERSEQLTVDAVREHVPATWLSAHWNGIQAKLQPGERVVAQQLLLLEVPSIAVTYSLGPNESETIEFEGLRLLAPRPSADGPLMARARWLATLRMILVAAPIVAGLAYLFRGSYYTSAWVLGTIVGTVACGLLLFRLLSQLTLGARPNRTSLAYMGAAVLLTSGMAIAAEPYQWVARRSVASGDLEKAEQELDALGEPTDPDLAELWGSVHLARSLARTTADEAAADAAKIPRGPTTESQQEQAQAHIDGLAFAEATAAVAAGNMYRIPHLLELTSGAFKTGPDGRRLAGEIELAKGKSCLASGDRDCAVDRANAAAKLGVETKARALRTEVIDALRRDATKATTAAQRATDLGSRVHLTNEALTAWSAYSKLAPPPTVVQTLEQQKAIDLPVWEQQEEVRRQKEVAARRREQAIADQKRKREEQIAAAQARLEEQQQRQLDRANASLLCCDGSESPSCTCGNPRRGCCSHHGGVCGCAAD